MDLSELCFHLRKRRGMYLPDERFATAVAFVEGYNVAFDGAPLTGFQDYVANRIQGHRSPVHWSYLIASAGVPGFLDANLPLDQLPPDSGSGLTDALVDLLEQFQERPPSPPEHTVP